MRYLVSKLCAKPLNRLRSSRVCSKLLSAWKKEREAITICIFFVCAGIYSSEYVLALGFLAVFFTIVGLGALLQKAIRKSEQKREARRSQSPS